MGISVLVADQERAFADALAARLEGESDIKVASAVQIKALGPSLADRNSADVLVLDGDLPGGAANRLCEEMSGRAKGTRVIMISSWSGSTRIAQAIRAGAAAWVGKDESVEHLLRVIRGVAGGETWLPPAQTGNVLRLLLLERELHSEVDRLLADLTPRERAVLACFAEADGRRDVVAERLYVSVNTVRTHMQNIMAKLGVHSALEVMVLTRDHAGRNSPDSG
jgi:DNA-binding NarL/FixJ family response regulator